MPKVNYPNIQIESGPWLLPESALTKLDEIVNAEWENLHRRREEIMVELADWQKDWRGRETRKVAISCQGGKTVAVTTFAEALRSPEMFSEKPTGFALHLQSAEIQGDLELNSLGSMSLSVRPAEAPEAGELFVVLRRWMLEFRPSTWQRIWKHSFGLHWALWFLVVWVAGFFLPQVPDSAHQSLVSEGQKLLAGGLDHQEVTPAVEVLLKLAVTREVKKIAITSWFEVLFFGGLGVALLLSIPPKTSIELGAGVRSFRFWKQWVRFIGFTLPTFTFGTFAWPYLEALIRDLF
jgi:hypothetical protein